MRPPPSNRTLVLSVVGTIACLIVLYFALQWGASAGHPAAPPRTAPAPSAH